MDLDEWEVLPGDGLVQTHDDGGKKLFSRKYHASNINCDFDMKYFVINSSRKSLKLADQNEKQLVPAVNTVETVPQENQFVDKKFKYPNPRNTVIYPRIEDDVLELIGNSEANEGKADRGKESEIEIAPEKTSSVLKTKDVWESEGTNIWKRSFSGVGAICSFGVAAATFCLVVLKCNGGNKQQYRHNHNIRFQIFPDEKRVFRDATKSEAFSSTKSVVSRAHIGGYYHGL